MFRAFLTESLRERQQDSLLELTGSVEGWQQDSLLELTGSVGGWQQDSLLELTESVGGWQQDSLLGVGGSWVQRQEDFREIVARGFPSAGEMRAEWQEIVARGFPSAIEMQAEWQEIAARGIPSFQETDAILRELTASMPDWPKATAFLEDASELQRLLADSSLRDDHLESTERWLDSPDCTDGELASLDRVRRLFLLLMFVLWVRVTPYLSARDLAEFARWWVEFVATLLSSS